MWPKPNKGLYHQQFKSWWKCLELAHRATNIHTAFALTEPNFRGNEMQNTLIATLAWTMSLNYFLMDELNENKAGSSDFLLNTVWSIASAVCALLFRGHLCWCCSNKFGWQCFPGQLFLREGVITFTSLKVSQLGLKKTFFWAVNERTIRLKPVLHSKFLQQNKMTQNTFSLVIISVQIKKKKKPFHCISLYIYN